MRRERSGSELIASLPWPVGVVLGIVVYAAVRYGITWYLASSNNTFLAPVAHHGADAVKIVAIGEFTPDAQCLRKANPSN